MSKRQKPIPGEEHLSRREGSDQWQIRFTIEHCRVRESSGTADREAAAALALRRHKEVWDEVKLGIKPKLELTVDEAFSRYWTEHAQHTTYGREGQRYQMHVLLHALGRNARLSSLDDRAINAAVQALRTRRPPEGSGRPETLSPSTINRYLATLAVVCKRARSVWKAEVGDWSPAEHKMKEPQHREVFLTHEQAGDLVRHAVGHLKPILMVAFTTGMRKSNVLALTWEQVSLDMGRAMVIQKGNRKLMVDLPGLAVQTLAALRPDPAERRGPVFWFGNPSVGCECERCKTGLFRGKPIVDVKRSFGTALKAAGLDEMDAGRLRFHDLRHSFASWLLGATGNLIVVKEALGHQDVATTQRYAHLMEGRKKTGIEGAVSGLLAAPAQERKKA